MLQRNDNESYNGNRLSNKIPFDAFQALKRISNDSLVTARVKMMDRLNVIANDQLFDDSKIYAADPDIGNIFSFEILNGSLKEFQEKEKRILLSSAVSNKYFGTTQSTGKTLKVYTFGDTLLFTVAAVYRDYPQNSHEEFGSFIRFDSASIQSLNFDSKEIGVFGRLSADSKDHYESILNSRSKSEGLSYRLQPLSDIYFGPESAGGGCKAW